MSQPETKHRLRIESYSHGIRVCDYDDSVLRCLMNYSTRFVVYGKVREARGVFVKKPVKVYACATDSRKEMRFHINQREELLQHLSAWGFGPDKIDFEEMEFPEWEKVEFEKIDTNEERDYQIKIGAYVADEAGPVSKLVTLQTGKGKTFIGLNGVHRLGRRTVLVLKPQFFKKWIPDLTKFFKFKKGELLTVQGSGELATLIELAQNNALDAKFIIISNTTLQNFISTYETHPDNEFLCGIRPEQLWATLKAGLMLVDEAHMGFHILFKIFCYTNIRNSLALSATVDSNDPMLKRMFDLVWPKRTRAPEIEYDKFIVVKNYWYSVNDPMRIRCKNAMNQYSQSELEKSILKNPVMKMKWLAMITEVVRHDFTSVMEKGQKAMVFCGMVEMCTAVRDHLREIFTDLTIDRYVSGDDFDEKNAADITITTVQSGGTGIDVPNLRYTLMTVALDSLQSNVQVLGRTRRLKNWPDIMPLYVFMSARELEAHVRYARSKPITFQGKVLSFTEVETKHRV